MKTSETILINIIAIAIVTLLFGTPFYLINNYSCKRYANLNNLEYNFSIMNGCLLKINNIYIEKENIREIR